MQRISLPNASGNLPRELTTSDQPYQTRFSGGYELPFFKHGNGFLHGAFGGLQINAVVVTLLLGCCSPLRSAPTLPA